jgi:WD40 repeat protein
MRIRSWIAAAAALLGLPACGPPRQRAMHVLDVGGEVQSLAFAPDGRTLACALSDRILLVDAEHGTRIRELGPVPEQFLLIAFVRDRLLSAGVAGYARLWDVTRGVEVDRLVAGAVRGLAVSPEGRWLVTTQGVPGGDTTAKDIDTITIWDLDHGHRSQPLTGSPGPADALAVNSEGLVAVGRYRMAIDIFEAQTGKRLRSMRGEGADFQGIKSVAFSPDAPHWLASGDNAGYITLWDAFDGRSLARFRPRLGLFLAPTPSIVATCFALHGLLGEAGSQGTAGLWRFEMPSGHGQAIATFSDHSSWEKFGDTNLRNEIYALAVNRDGTLVATSHRDHGIRMWRGSGLR